MSRPVLLVVDDDPSARSIVRKALASEGLSVEEVGDADTALAEIGRLKPGIVLLDLFLPDPRGIDLLKEIGALPAPPYVIIITGHSEHTFVMEAMKWGAYDYVVKPFDIDRLRGVVKDALASIRDSKGAAAGPTRPAVDANAIVGKSTAMQMVFKLAGRAASSEETVLITGESGVGKEVIAHLVHAHSSRMDGPFVSVNCAAIPSGLVEAELFGYERGAFTGADRARPGKFSAAHRGTLFMDEVGDLPLDSQAKLLRVLQDHEVTPLGSTRPNKVDTRVLCASNVNLWDRVGAGRFREDLYYRLAVLEIAVPPLRERREDLRGLVDHFTREALAEHHLRKGGLTENAMGVLSGYEFPGNVRELKNLVRKLIAIHRERPITPDLLPPQIASVRKVPDPSDWLSVAAQSVRAALERGEPDLAGRFRQQLEDVLVKEALEFSGGSQVKAARLIGMHRNTLRRKKT